jgi:undecaprenyl-phosphate galactose phosphotransferase
LPKTRKYVIIAACVFKGVVIMNEMVNVNSICDLRKISKLKLNLYLLNKRIFDILLSFIGVIELLFVAFFVKVAYMLHGDFKSIFYTQKRIGMYGKEFNFYKFRTMIKDADEVLFKLLEENEELREEYKINKKLKNDPRVTKVGKFLRKASLDELPQYINILKGDMSLIGNRPYLPREKEDMKEYFSDIVMSKPGLTGYWQVSGRSDTTFEERLKLERYYSHNFNTLLDLKIFIKTHFVVLFRKGAEK